MNSMLRPSVIVACCTTAFVAAVVAGCASGGSPAPALSGLAADGEQLVEARGCLSCHSTDGSSGTGPTWQGLAGSDVALLDGETVRADRAYLRRSILDPDADTVAGYAPGLMRSAVPSGSLTDDEIEAIVAYLETLGNHEATSGD